MAKENKKEKMSTSIKFEKDLLNRIREDAVKETRTLTGQIEYMLRKYYEIKDEMNN